MQNTRYRYVIFPSGRTEPLGRAVGGLFGYPAKKVYLWLGMCRMA